MKKRVLALLCAVAVAGTSQNFLPAHRVNAAVTAIGTTYYISSIHGDNSKDGTSEDEAWETLDKLKKITLEPGDSILLERGSVFDGYIRLYDVHGTEDAPIVIGSYGDEGEQRPAIHANGQGIWYQDYNGTMDNKNHRSKGYVSSAILLYDVDFVEVSGLELTNQSDDFAYFAGASNVPNDIFRHNASIPETSEVDKVDGRMDRTGVAGIAKDGGTMQHIYLDDLYIHNVDGNIEDKHMDNGGIQLNALPPADEDATGIARYDDVRITNCYVKDVSRAGICIGYTYKCNEFNGKEIADETAQTFGHTNLLLEGNYVQNAGNDAIVAMYAFRPVIQRNVADKAGADLEKLDTEYKKASFWQPFCAAIWPWKCKDAIFQYNEAFDTVFSQDGQAWDVDWSDGTVYQYNYSHNNGGGCLMVCGAEAYRSVFRYNISQNDLTAFIGLPDNSPNADIYHNVFYLDGDRSTTAFRKNPGSSGTATITNNIFYNNSKNKDQDTTLIHPKRSYANNLFYGYANVPTGNGNITGDPMFADAGKAPTSTMGTVHERDVFEGYKLQPGSPAINAGAQVEGAPGEDFFGNKVDAQPDIGVAEYTSGGAAKGGRTGEE